MNRHALFSPALALAGLVACHPAAAALGGAAIAPNYYELQDTLGGVHITLDKHLPTPSLTYQANGKTRTFKGGDLTVESTAIGTLVTVTTKFMPDVDYVNLSILIPDMMIPSGSSSLAFASMAVVTDHRAPFTAPPVTGVVEVYKPPVILKGVAKAVP